MSRKAKAAYEAYRFVTGGKWLVDGSAEMPEYEALPAVIQLGWEAAAGEQPDEDAAEPEAPVVFPCCQHCTDGDGMLPCGDFHDEPCGTGDCGLVTDAELAHWRKGLQL